MSSNNFVAKKAKASTPISGKGGAAFTWRGYIDCAMNRQYPKAYEEMAKANQRNYERGRLYAATIQGAWGRIPAWPINETFAAFAAKNFPKDVIDDLMDEMRFTFAKVG